MGTIWLNSTDVYSESLQLDLEERIKVAAALWSFDHDFHLSYDGRHVVHRSEVLPDYVACDVLDGWVTMAERSRQLLATILERH